MLKTLMIQKVLGSTIRHLATGVGGWLAVEGYADEQTAQAITGGLIAAGGIGLSFLEKQTRF